MGKSVLRFGPVIVLVAVAAYYVLLLLVGPPPPALAVAILLVGVGLTAWTMARREGLERQVFLEATSIAFFVMLAVVGVSTVASDDGGLPFPSAWLWDLGVAAWCLTTVVRTRQLT